MNEIEALLALIHVPRLGPVRLRRYIEDYGSALEVLENEPELASAAKQPGWQQDLAAVQAAGVQLISYQDPRYPQKLRSINDAPLLLYVLGDLRPTDDNGIAVIGTRHSTRYGLEMAERIGSDLAGNGFCVVSGLARGIDTAAHQGALQRGRTLAVIGSGLNRLYPEENRELAARIIERGALISEFPMSTPPDRQNFPQRNRIVSGMTRGTLLIQAPRRSGAIITMELAYKQGRDCFAIPGPVGDAFAGNHEWIRDRRAHLVEGAQDICMYYGDLFSRSTRTTVAPALDAEEILIVQGLKDEELTIEELLEKTQLSVIKLNVLLMSLILKGVVREFPGKIYKKCLTHG